MSGKLWREQADAEARADKPTVRIRPASYYPTKAELEEDVSIPDATPEELARVVGRQVNIEKIKEDARPSPLCDSSL